MIKVLTFDCYGTLIDWESGILKALRPILGHPHSDMGMLAVYGRLEQRAERGKFKNYKSVLRQVARGMGLPETCLVDSIASWKPFRDTVPALKRLKKRFKLAVISNTDRSIFAKTESALCVRFDWKILAEDVRAYKPSLKNFHCALKEIGLPKENILHVAQSVFHDIVPANKLGIKSVLIRRRGRGATPIACARPDMIVPDMKALAEYLLET